MNVPTAVFSCHTDRSVYTITQNNKKVEPLEKFWQSVRGKWKCYKWHNKNVWDLNTCTLP